MLVEMTVAAVTLDPLTNMPIIILRSNTGKKVLPIWIGLLEATAIATEIEKIKVARPMTHDLIKNILSELELKIDKIVVTDLRENTYYAIIFLIDKEGKVHEIDSRPSDAIALSLRAGCKLFVNEEVINKSHSAEYANKSEVDKWTEYLENLGPEAFGKYKM